MRWRRRSARHSIIPGCLSPASWATAKRRRGRPRPPGTARNSLIRPEDERGPKLRLIFCHLGGGCSLCATVGGRSIDTTMGFTPLDDNAICTRSGALDPGILLYLLRKGIIADELEEMLNKKSGLKGLSGVPGDTRPILPAAKAGNAHAQFALDVFTPRLRAGMGEMMAALGRRPDAIIFTVVSLGKHPFSKSIKRAESSAGPTCRAQRTHDCDFILQITFRDRYAGRARGLSRRSGRVATA